ncbi:biotin/lipoyl-binding protein [Serratia marcescens]|uniref:biotin/lipoyl-binding protein n=1 Tax=Serratia marcescens TaxID=615 RepID=UPI003D16EDC4
MFRERTLVLLRPALTLIAVLIAAGVLWQLYLYYTYAPQTRDGKIRADVVPLATDVSGKVDAVHIHDNQVVHKGQLLLSLDKVRLRNALDQAEAAVERANVQLRHPSAKTGAIRRCSRLFHSRNATIAAMPNRWQRPIWIRPWRIGRWRASTCSAPISMRRWMA